MNYLVSKHCNWCDTLLPIEEFHKHKRMKDGRLNKCRKCVKKTVDKWRTENPNCRKEEHARNRNRKGTKTREQWLKDVKENAIGRKISSNKYSQKRRAQKAIGFCEELDAFAFEEASSLKYLRAEMCGGLWHIDHIVPLNHKDACGLHTASNFQVVPAKWNLQKLNTNMQELIFGMPFEEN